MFCKSAPNARRQSAGRRQRLPVAAPVFRLRRDGAYSAHLISHPRPIANTADSFVQSQCRIKAGVISNPHMIISCVIALSVSFMLFLLYRIAAVLHFSSFLQTLPLAFSFVVCFFSVLLYVFLVLHLPLFHLL